MPPINFRRSGPRMFLRFYDVFTHDLDDREVLLGTVQASNTPDAAKKAMHRWVIYGNWRKPNYGFTIKKRT